MGSFFDSLLSESSDQMGSKQRFVRIMLRAREQTDATGKEKLIQSVKSIVDSYDFKSQVQPLFLATMSC